MCTTTCFVELYSITCTSRYRFHLVFLSSTVDSCIYFTEMSQNSKIYFYLLLYLTVTYAIGDKKNDEDTNESNVEELVEVEEETYDDRSQAVIEHTLDVIKIVAAPDLTKEDPEHRSKTVNGQTDDISNINRLNLEFDSSDADLLSFLEENLKRRYPLIFSRLNNEKDQPLVEPEVKDETMMNDVEVKEQTPEEIEGRY